MIDRSYVAVFDTLSLDQSREIDLSWRGRGTRSVRSDTGTLVAVSWTGPTNQGPRTDLDVVELKWRGPIDTEIAVVHREWAPTSVAMLGARGSAGLRPLPGGVVRVVVENGISVERHRFSRKLQIL